MTSDETGDAPSDVVGERVRELRKRKGLTVEQAARLCAEVDAPELTANAIYAIEGGRRRGGVRTRKVTVDELFALAAALDVSPLALLLPSGPRDYAVTPKRVAGTVRRLYDWIVGRTGTPFGMPYPSGKVAYSGIPKGLPDWLAEHERHIADERDLELNSLREMARLALAAQRAVQAAPADPEITGG